MKRKNKHPVIPQNAYRDGYLLVACVVCLGLAAYFFALSTAVQLWSRSPDEQHGFLVFPISLLLLYLRRDEFPTGTRRIDFRGCLLIALAAMLRVYGEAYVRPWMEMWSLPIWIGGVVWLFGGWQLFRWAFPSIAFLFFMAPLPGQLQTTAGFPLQVVAATGGGWLLQMLGQPAFVSGTTILLGENVLDVERACAGLRMFQGMLAVSVAWSLFARYSWRRLLCLFAIAPIVAIFVNILRIAVTGMLFQYISGDAAKSFTHDWAGILMIPTGAVIYFCIDTIVDRLRAWNGENSERWILTGSMAAIGILIISFAGFTIQRRQQRVAIDFVLIQAREHKNKNSSQEDDTASQLYQQYLSARPKDAEVISEFADLILRSPRDQRSRAAQLYELAWRSDSTRIDDAIKALRMWNDSGAWKMLWERSDEMVPKLSGQFQIDAMRMRTTAVSKLPENAIALSGSDKMLKGCREAMEKDYDYLEHTWQSARLTRLQPASEISVVSVEQIIAELPGEARSKFPFDPETMKEEKELRKSLNGPASQALAIVDRWVASHPDMPMPLLYRVALLDETISKPSSQLSIDRAMNLVNKSMSDHPESFDKGTAAKVYFVAGQRAIKDDRALAKELLDRCKELQPTGYQVYVLLGELIKADAHEERIALFEEAVKNCGTDELAITLPLAETYIASQQEDEAQKLLSPLETKMLGLPPTERGKVKLMLASTRASGLSQQERQREAIDTLDKTLRSLEVQTQRRNLASLYARAQFQLGVLYRSFNQEALARAAFQEGGRFDESSTIWQLDAANTFEKAGNFKAAIDQYNRILKITGNQQPGILLQKVRCLLALQKRAKPSAELLEEARKIIRDAVKRGADAEEACVLLAESFVIARDNKTALKVIETQLKSTPSSSRLLFSSAYIRQLSGDHSGAMMDVERFIAAGGKPSVTLLLKVKIWESNDDFDKASSEIAAAARRLSAEDLKPAKIQLTLGYFRKGPTELAKTRLESLASDYQNDLEVQRLAAELFGELRKEAELKVIEENLIRIEGDNGTQWRMARAARLLRSEDADLREAESLISRLEQLLPDWPRTHCLRGQMQERMGRLPQAIASYEQAWSLGLRDANLASCFLSALYKTGQNQRASDLISQLEDMVPNSTALFNLAMPQLVQSKKSEYVLNLARSWVADSPNYENHVLLGRTLMAVANSRQNKSMDASAETVAMLSEAQKVFEDAIQSDPDKNDAWVAAFLLQAEIVRDRDGAMAKLEQLSNHIGMKPFQRSLVLAQLYNAIGEGGRAGMYFEETLRLADNESEQKRQDAILKAGQFFSSRRIEKSIQLYRGLLADPKSADGPAMTQLVLALAQQLNIKSLNEAISLHNSKRAVSINSEASDKILLGKLLVARTELNAPLESDNNERANALSDREVAISLLESISPRTAEVAGLLAGLYASNGQFVSALNTYRESLRLEDPTPERMIRLLNFWNREFANSNEYRAIADQYLNELKKRPGYVAEWLRLSMDRAKFQAKSKGDNEQKFLERSDAENVKDFCDSFVTSASTAELPNSIYDLMLGLSRSSREDLIPRTLDEVSNRLLQSANSARTMALPSAIASTTIRLSSNAKFAGRLARWLQEQFPAASLESAVIAREIGDAVYLSGDPKAAIAYYRRAIALAPNDVDAINNLAAALAEAGNSKEESLALIDRAIELDPKNFERKDTKLVVAILARDWDLAKAISKDLSGQFVGTVLLHRAVVAAETGDAKESQTLFNRARDASVERNLVVPSDKQLFQRLAERFMESESLVSQPIPES